MVIPDGDMIIPHYHITPNGRIIHGRVVVVPDRYYYNNTCYGYTRKKCDCGTELITAAAVYTSTARRIALVTTIC